MRDVPDDDIFIDENGCLTERVWLDGQAVIIHHDDIPNQDLTIVQGIPCTTALRTVIDIALSCEPGELERIVQDCLERKLFTVEEARARTAELDMLAHPGAALLRGVLPRWPHIPR